MANILLVEDDPDVAEMLAEVLMLEGHDVRTAKNGEDGLARLLGFCPDLILCDVDMPVLSGPEMAFQLFLRDAGMERIPIMLCSAVADLPSVARAVGTPYHLSKPFTVQQLITGLSRALEERIPPRPGRLVHAAAV